MANFRNSYLRNYGYYLTDLFNIIRRNECKYMKDIFELRMKDQIEERSSQLLRNLSSCEKKA